MSYSNILKKALLCFSIISILFISSCNSNTNIQPEIKITATLTEEIFPTKTATIAPTLEPSPTETIEPTFTPMPTSTPQLALLDDNLSIWSIPKDFLLLTSGTGFSKENYSTTYDGYIENERMNIRIPASGVIVEVEFNQPINDDLVFNIYYLDSESAWYTSEIIPNQEDPTKGYFLLNHNFVLDPPFWEITYLGKLENLSRKVFWEKSLRLFKPLPNTCWDGSLPDPVTMYCPNYDGDWNFRDFENFNPNADIFTSGKVELGEEYKD